MKQQKQPHTQPRKKRSNKLHKNIRPSIIILLIPILIGAITIYLIATGLYSRNLSDLGNKRLITNNWEAAEASLIKAQPEYSRQYAYYKVKPGQTAESLAEQFSVDTTTLQALNPGAVVAGTTLKIPPVQHPLVATDGPNNLLSQAVVTDVDGMLHVNNKFGVGPQIITTIPELKNFLQPYNAIEQTGPSTYRITRPMTLDGNIRLDITKATVTTLEIQSIPQNATCLCMDQGAMLIDGVTITSYDPATKKPDITYGGSRGFIRMKNGRMDIMNSHISNMGNAFEDIDQNATIKPALKGGGAYGTSWRISSGELGENITTGWVENNTFTNSYFGAYSFGASGMMWRSNRFSHNTIYGLDPHDDSNNAVIEKNIFDHNGKHGFIVSKRCNYNIIRNNISYDNKYHGFMLHGDSAYNLVENNIAYHNLDNFVVYESNYNTIRKNKSYIPVSSHVRINKKSLNTYVVNNQLFGGTRGVYLYDGVMELYAAHNNIHNVSRELQTNGVKDIVYTRNTSDAIHYDILSSDQVIFGENTILKRHFTLPDPAKTAEKIRSL